MGAHIRASKAHRIDRRSRIIARIIARLFGRYDEGAVPAWFREIALTEITEEQEGLPDGAVDVDGPLSQIFSVLCIKPPSFAGIFAAFVFLTLVASPRQQMDLATQSRSARLILHVAPAGSLVGV